MRLVCSIITTLFSCFLCEAGVFLIIAHIYAFPGDFFLLFLSVHFIFQMGIMVFLILNRRHFYNFQSGKRETMVNGANKITLFRISMLPFLVFLLLAVERFSGRIPGRSAGPLLVFAFAVTFLSDFIDGKLARVRKLETYIGKILDSGSDYMLLGATAVSFFFFKLLKPWLFWIIIGRLFINALGMFTLFLVRKKLSPQTTIFGKVAIAAIMVLFVLESASISLPGSIGGIFPSIIRYIEIGTGVLLLLSVVDKIIYFLKAFNPAAEAE